MKRKRRTISLLLAAVLALQCLMLSGCAVGRDADVHVFYYNYSDTYVTSVRAALDAHLESNGISYQNYDGNNNQTTQTEQVKTAITKGARVILVNLINTGSADAANTVVAAAKGAGIPVIFFNREVPDDVVKSYEKCAYVGTDAAEAGHLQGEMIGEYLMENFERADLNGDGKISYILFKGEEGNNEAIFRTRYAVEDANRILVEAGKPPLSFYDAANASGYLVDQSGAWSATAANQYMTTALASHNDANGNMIELVICNNDGMAEGAITALNTVGYNTGGEKRIPVFGVDATDAARNLIGGGKMAGTIKQDAQGMAQVLAALSENAVGGKGLLDGTDAYHKDEDVAKIRIPYEKYLG
ncbi:MAG: galactose ABC transporter substrate-binding protein [Clostridia bacterium]|nr:galactose ABC transporter substrate-binding protein [Clostridia bacterium]